MRASITTALACAFLSLAACAPVYQDFTHYAAPADQAGLQCLADAEAENGDCLLDSRDAFEVCRDARRREAERAYEIARDEYEWEARGYRRCSREVERRRLDVDAAAYENIRRDWRQAKEQFRRCKKRAAPGAPNTCVDPGAEPARPPLDEPALRNRIRKDCGYGPSRPELRNFEDYSACGSPEGSCKSLYDAAYRACGGQVTIETRCVANCD